MNTAVRAITSRSLSLWVLPVTLKKTHFFIFSLMMACLLSAFSLVYVKDMNRRLTSQVENVQSQSVQLHNQWTQLLLQKSNLAGQAQVAQEAKKDFHMFVPSPTKVVMLNT